MRDIHRMLSTLKGSLSLQVTPLLGPYLALI
jgi:hypothetical protein